VRLLEPFLQWERGGEFLSEGKLTQTTHLYLASKLRICVPVYKPTDIFTSWCSLQHSNKSAVIYCDYISAECDIFMHFPFIVIIVLFVTPREVHQRPNDVMI
jgi:hypothetical protein